MILLHIGPDLAHEPRRAQRRVVQLAGEHEEGLALDDELDLAILGSTEVRKGVLGLGRGNLDCCHDERLRMTEDA